ncbi:MAG: hypothetical protein V3T83_20585 [Acidobacteriota bacterium]
MRRSFLFNSKPLQRRSASPARALGSGQALSGCVGISSQQNGLIPGQAPRSMGLPADSLLGPLD